MRVEPPRSEWRFPGPARFDPDDDLVAAGADLAPGTLLEAYRHGIFPMPSGRRGDPLLWFSPVRRGVLPLDGLRVSRSLRRSRRKFEIRVDTALTEVIEGCADPRRPAGWIDPAVKAAYVELHRLGWVHSVEAWRDDRLAGGLYGVSIGGLFAGESMFHRETDASKAALAALVDLLCDEPDEPRLLDVQWQTPHLASLGVVQVPRREYLTRLPGALAAAVPRAFR
jgi:leucyl/phenylalanyl-tRNA--protein transferase